MIDLLHLDLFSGIGGIAIAAQWVGFQTVAFCEIDPYCQKVLRKRFGDGIVIHDDIRQLDGTRYAGTIDVLTGGFPCQPYSVAGKRRGDKDPRALWGEMRRIIHEAKPAWVVGENVANFANMGLDAACADLESEGYEVQPFIIPAVAVGAPHERKRVFIVAFMDDTKIKRRDYGVAANNGQTERDVDPPCNTGEIRAAVAMAHSNGGTCGRESGNALHEGRRTRESGQAGIPQATGRKDGTAIGDAESTSANVAHSDWWTVEPNVGRVANGIPARVDRLRALGNAVVPQQVYPIMRLIAQAQLVTA